MIERQNILDLIGKYSNRYCSCIITCFSFDFTFFEERVMSVLRVANIKNVNVLIDGNYLEHSLENALGHEFSTHRTYSINPIYETGVFHPKIMLLSGPKHGLLIIGSGNLTSSGLSTNDEIWSAFHLDSLASKNASVFAEVWRYLQTYLNQARGFNRQKIEWISQHSPWLKGLENSVPEAFVQLDNNQELRFIANRSTAPIFREIQNWLPKDKISCLTIISPYFDEEGKFLVNISRSYQIEEFKCITDTKFGILPYKMVMDLQSQIKFYDWSDIVKEFDGRFNRLHAKLFHFQYANGLEYLYLGSANATLAAFGSDTANARNAEAGILLRRNSNSNYLKELGISIGNSEPFSLEKYTNKAGNKGDTICTIKFDNRIVYAEINSNYLTFYMIEQAEKEYQLLVVNNESKIIDSFVIKPGRFDYKIELKNSSKAKRVCLSLNGQRVSNYAIVHNVALQSKCNPDPIQAELNELISRISYDPENTYFFELLRYADYLWIDDDNNDPLLKGGSVSKCVNSEEHKVYQTISEDEFNKLNSLQVRHAEILNNSSVQIADVLNLVSKGLIKSQTQVLDIPELMFDNTVIDNQDGSGVEINRFDSEKVLHEKEIRAIKKHISKIKEYLSEGLKPLFKTRVLQDSPCHQINHKVLSNISSFIDLLYLFYGKKYHVYNTIFSIRFDKNLVDKIRKIEKSFKLICLDKSNQDQINIKYYEVESSLFTKVKEAFDSLNSSLFVYQREYHPIKRETTYIKEGEIIDDKGVGLKHCLVNVLGKFLIHANTNAGFQNYSYELVNDRINAFRKDLFEKATFLILNVTWKKRELLLRDILLLDLLHHIYPSQLKESDIAIINDRFESYYTNKCYHGKIKKNQIDEYLKSFLPRYIKWRRNYENNSSVLKRTISSLQYGSIIYHRNIGFACFIGKQNGDIQLENPGFNWDKLKQTYSSKFVCAQSNIITYNCKVWQI